MADQKHKIIYELLLKQQVTDKLDKINNGLIPMRRNMELANGASARMSGGLGIVNTGLKAFAGYLAVDKVMDFAGSIVTAGARIETLETQFKPLLGSAEAAKDRIAELSQFAAKTPFQLPSIANASRILETLTEGTLSTSQGLTLVGDAAAQSGEGFENLATHVGRAYSALTSNRAAGESLARLQELGLLSGQARNKIEALQQQAKGREAWATLQDELKKSNGSMLELSGTFDGKVSTMKDNWDQLLVTIGNSGAVLDTAKAGIDLLTESIQWWNEALGGGPEEPAALKSTKELLKLQKGSKFWEDKLAEAREKANNPAQIKRLEDRVAHYKELIKQNNDEFTAAVKANAEKKKNDADEKERLKREKERLKVLEELRESRKEHEGTVTAFISASEQRRAEIGKKADEIEKMRIENRFKDMIEKVKRHKDLVANLEAERDKAINAARLQREIEADLVLQEEKARRAEEAEALRLGFEEEVKFARMEASEAEIERIRIEYDRKIQLLRDAGASEKEAVEAKELAITKVEEEAGRKRVDNYRREQEMKLRATSQGLQGFQKLFEQAAQNNKAAAVVAKGLAITDATINTYVAANKALAAFPPPFNYFAMAGTIASGLANVAQIKSQKFARGGIVEGTSYSGDRVPAQMNSGEMVLTRAQQNRLFSIANGRGTATTRQAVNVQGGPVSITVGAGADAEMVERVVSEAIGRQNVELAEMLRQNATFGVTA